MEQKDPTMKPSLKKKEPIYLKSCYIANSFARMHGRWRFDINICKQDEEHAYQKKKNKMKNIGWKFEQVQPDSEFPTQYKDKGLQHTQCFTTQLQKIR